MKFLPCELHCHTLHSDGSFEVKELQRSAIACGLSVIALTDHNTSSGFDEVDNTIIPVIKGIEWTTYFGHMLVLGANGFTDWRDALPDNIDEKIKAVKADNGLVGVAHPFQIGSPVCTGGRWEFKVRDWNMVDYIEVWHEDISTSRGENERALSFWTELLDKGYHIAASYGRDWHRQEKSGEYGCTYLGLDDISAQGALDALKNGRTVISTGALLCFTAQKDNIVFNIGDTVNEGEYSISFFTELERAVKNTEYNEIRIISNGNDAVYTASPDKKSTVLEFKSGHWYRAELWGTVGGENRPLAITSPLYCK